MKEDRNSLAQWIDIERERIISFLQAFIRCKSHHSRIAQLGF